MERYDSKLYEAFKSCKTFEPKYKTIDVSDLNQVCTDFRLSFRDCMDCIKTDSQQRVPFTELTRYIRDYAYRHGVQSPPNIHPIQSSLSPLYTSYLDDSCTPYSSEEPYMNSTRQSHIPVSPPEEEVHDPTIRSKVIDSSHWVTDQQHHHMPSPPAGNGDQWYQGDSDDMVTYPKGRTGYCRNCKSLQRQYHNLKEKLMKTSYENDQLQTILEKANKDLQHSSEYYQKHWQKQAKEFESYLAVSERERHKLQSQLDKLQREYQQKLEQLQKALRDKDKLAKRLQEEADSDGSARNYFKGGSSHYEDAKRGKDDLEATIKQYKKYYVAAKQECDQLKEQLRDTERDRWYLKDENQRLQCQLLRNDPQLQRHPEAAGLHPSRVGKSQPPVLRTPSTEQDSERPEREVSAQKAKSVKSAPSEASDILNHTTSLYMNAPDDLTQIITVLNEDVCTNVLPETFSPEQQQQIIYALQNCHSIQELIRCLVSYVISAPQKSQEDYVENEHLRSKVKHLDSQCQRLTMSFEMAKQETESMWQKLAQVEGNNCRLRQITKLCQQACEVHELLYEMKFFPSSGGHGFNQYNYPSRNSDQADLGKHVLVRARHLLQNLDLNSELQHYIPTSDGKFSLSGWNLSMSQYTGTTSGLSSGASSIGEIELNSSEMDQLKVYYQGLVSYASQLMDTLVEVDGLKGLNPVKEQHIVKDSTLDPTKIQQAVADMEEYVDTEELCKIREEKAELRSQLYMIEQSKRSMELQVSRVQLHVNMLERNNMELQLLYKTERDKRRRLREKVKLYKSQAEGSVYQESSTAEAQLALERERDALHRYDDLYHYLQKHVQESQTMSEQLVDFVKELLSANRALVEAFERAKKRQQYEKRQLKQEIVQLTNRLHGHLP